MIPMVAADTMNYWIERKPEALRRTLTRVQILLINDGEARLLAGESNLVRAARVIQEMGPGTLVIKRGEYGLLLARGADLFVLPAFPLASLADPTGAGDSFAGGMMGYLTEQGNVEPQTLKTALAYGTLAASFTVEGFSLDGLRRIKREDLRHRMEEYQRMLSF